MERDMLSQAAAFLLEKRRKARWYKVVSCLAMVVVFCTTYALILPAITLANKTTCGLEEHVHTEDCYRTEVIYPQSTMNCSLETLNVHTHDGSCYDGSGNLVCGYADFVVHTHDSHCYSEDGSLICTLPEIRPHTHTASCYTEVRTLLCQEKEDPGHTHTDACYKRLRGDLLCTEEEKEGHTHTAACYETVRELTCGSEEEGHEHDESCYTERQELVCGQEEFQGHRHTDDCYAWTSELICTQEERAPGHVHDDTCYQIEWVLTCSENEVVLHSHSSDCYDESGCLMCGKLETLRHQHTDACIQPPPEDAEPREVRTLVCGLPEHVHEDSCYPTTVTGDPTADVETAADWEATLEDVTLTGDYHQDVTAIAKSQLGYEESTLNTVTTEAGTVRGYTRYGQWYGDSYGDWCAMFASFCLHYAGVEDMPLESSCTKWIMDLSDAGLYCPADGVYVPQAGELVFFDFHGTGGADHVGLVTEVLPETEEEPAQVTVIEGNSGDRVREVAYELTDGRIVGCGQLPEQTFYCGKTAHVHSDSCGTDCGLEEHIHTEECLISPDQLLTQGELAELSCTGPDYTVRVLYGADAGLPEGVTLDAREIPSDSAEYRSYYDQTLAALDGRETAQPETLVFARFFDIRFLLDGEELEPAAPVFVTITYESMEPSAEPADCQAIHFAGDGPELLEVWTEEQESGATSFTHTQDSFSVVGSLMTISTPENPTDVGPRVLPVDYYVYIDGQWTCVGSTKTGWYGDYSANGWLNTNRDCITVEQANSVLGAYGFDAGASNAALQLAYQRKETDKDAALHCDTQSYTDAGKSSAALILIPLARNADPASGYNVYFLPGNTNNNYSSSLGSVIKTGSEFYTVSVYDPSHLAYETGEEPETQTVRTGSSATVMVNALSDESGAVWQCVDTSWASVADGTTNGDTVTFNLTNVTQTLRVTPMAKNIGEKVYKTVYYLVFLDGKWTNVGTTTPYYQNNNLLKSADGNYRHFVTSAQAESVLAPYGFRSAAYSSTVGGTSVLAHQLGEPDLNTAFWTDGGGEQLSDGSWAIGLSYVTSDDTDYSFYYLPSNPGTFQGKTPGTYTSASEEMSGNRFWSVKVRDDSQAVYSNGELSGMVQYVQNGGEATVSVRNADGILWSCVGKNGEAVEVTASQSGGYTTFTISGITQPIEVTATLANPSFTVQYYGNIPRFATSGSNALTVIDTSGRALPTNGGSMATKSLYLEGTGQNTNQNAGNATQLYRIATTMELTKLYSDETFQYETHPSLCYFNKLKDNDSYTLKEVWVLKSGKDAASTDRNDWDIYTYQSDMDFTNEAGQAAGNTILITDGMVIRLVTDSSSGSYYNGTTFYDYNISSGQNSDGRWRTGITGINSESNYGTSLNGQRNWRSGADIFAFGNANCGTGMSGYLFDGSTLNKYSSKNSGYGGATFRLAAGLNSDGTIRYNDWIVAPKLFNDGDATGKQTYTGSSLTFDRVGDTYTLSAATLANSNGKQNTLSGLQYFFNPSPTNSTTHTHIFTNNFWPMDEAAGRTDALWGKYSSPGSFQGFNETNGYNWSDLAKDFPVSDDGNAHNWFFGMNFAISFSLTADYEGPLEYYFFGDDDLWVFLDSKLVCDIGGVHSSIGEYVNLRDYLPVGSSGQHTLSFFYTERGASGSTCYMSFTLPSVSSATTERDTGRLQISKEVNAEDGLDYSAAEYQFQVDLLTTENGSALNQTFGYARSDGTYGTIRSGGTVTLGAGDTITISGLPAGAYYKVTELSTEGYKTTVNNSEGYIASGKIETGTVKPAAFVNTPYYELPSTGGGGTSWYTIGGLSLMAMAYLLYRNRKREKRHRKGVLE